MDSHPPQTLCPGALLLPFGGLGLDMTEVRHKVRGLLLAPFPKREEPRQEPSFFAPPMLSGYRLLIRLSRETLGS